MPRPVSERAIVFLVGAAQFVNILDFVIVMPLGPDFAGSLGISVSHLGYIGGAYTAAAAVSGLAGSLFLDRFDRRSALAVALFGLAIATALCGLADDLPTLLAARITAGLFGGPATSIAFSIIADAVPSERRGKAMGAVMGAFSLASIIGVPAGLKLAQWGSWRLPFFSVAALAMLTVLLVLVAMPPLRGHLEGRGERHVAPPFSALLRPTVLLSWLMTAITMAAGFLLIPNIAAHLQRNLGYPRDSLDLLYFFGGIASFVTLRVAGALVDRHGSLRTGSLGALLLVAVLWLGFYAPPPGLPVLPVFVVFFVALGFRNVSYNTLASKVPSASERARFMSIQSAVQHGASAVAAVLSAKLLSESPDGRLLGMPLVTGLSMALTVLLPVFLFAVERRLPSLPGGAVRPEPPSGVVAPTAGIPRKTGL